MIYRILLSDLLDSSWNKVFDGLVISELKSRRTSLTGDFPDQAALHGCLKKIRDLGLTLISVNPVENGENEKKGARK